MTTTHLPSCALNISAETLSNYRDAALPHVERERIANHLHSCARCRDRLAGYERSAVAIRSERVPSADGRLWQGVRAGLDRRTSRPRVMRRVLLPSRQMWSGLGAVAAVLLIVVGFARLLNRAPAGPPVLNGHALTWTRANLSPQAQGISPEQIGQFSNVVPVGDGTIAYACAPTQPNGRQPALFATHDSGATWTMTQKVATGPANACYVVVDQTDPQTALLVVGNAASPAALATTPDAIQGVFVTQDGGGSLVQMPTIGSQGVDGLATHNATAYLLAGIQQDGSGGTLFVSTDFMNTWATVQGVSNVDHFWLEHDQDGTLYVSERTSQSGEVLLNGRLGSDTWTRLAAPAAQAFISTGQFAANTPPTFCAITPTLPWKPDVSCSGDGGKTWADRHAPALPWTTDKAQMAKLPAPDVIGIDSNGALLAYSDALENNQPVYTLYRLSAGATEWESLGPLPAGTAPSTTIGDGVASTLWALPSAAGLSAYTATYTPASAPQPTAPSRAAPTTNTNTQPTVSSFWQPATLPPGFTATGIISSIGVAPSDGSVAYACAIPTGQNGGQPHLWVNRTDGQGSWQELAILPMTFPAQTAFKGCTLAVDATDETSAIVSVTWGTNDPNASTQGVASFVTHDQGGHWTQIPLSGAWLVSAYVTQADLDNTTSDYILAFDESGPGNSPPTIYLSSDGMRTLQATGQGPVIGGETINLWPGGQPGMLFVQVKNQLGLNELEETQDDGKSWSQVGPRNAETVAVQPSAFNNPLRMCFGTTTIVNGALQSGDVQCSNDGGQTWQTYPAPTLTYSCDGCAKGGASTATGQASALWVTPEGNLWAVVPNGANSQAILNLTKNTQTWHAMGTNAPISSVVYAPFGPGSDLFWLFPGGLASSSGTAGLVGPNGTVYIRP